MSEKLENEDYKSRSELKKKGTVIHTFVEQQHFQIVKSYQIVVV